MTMSEQTELPESKPQVVNLSQVDVETVKAELVRMHQSTAQAVIAEDADLSVGLVAEVHARNAELKDSVAAHIQTNEMTVRDSLVVAAQAETLSLNGATGVVLAGGVEFGNAYAGLVAGREIRGERIESVILLSPKVEGNVTTVMDTRTALIAGLVGGLFAGLMLLLGRALFGKR
jgi:hypothetical protein